MGREGDTRRIRMLYLGCCRCAAAATVLAAVACRLFYFFYCCAVPGTWYIIHFLPPTRFCSLLDVGRFAASLYQVCVVPRVLAYEKRRKDDVLLPLSDATSGSYRWLATVACGKFTCIALWFV